MPPSPPNSEIDAEFEKEENYFLKNDFYEDELIPDEKLPPVTIFHVTNRYNLINDSLNDSLKPIRRPLSQNSLNSSQSRRHKNHDKFSKKTCENGLQTKTKKHKSGEIGRSRNASGDNTKEGLPSSLEINFQQGVINYQNYDSKPNFQTVSSAYDSAMLSALNNGLNSNNRSEKKTIDGIFFNYF